MRYFIFLSVGVAVGLVLMYGIESFSVVKEVPEQPIPPAVHVTKDILSVNYDAECSKQARSFFKDNSYENDSTSSYTNHFNTKLNKCFILISSMDYANSATLISLVDVNENKTYIDLWKNSDTGAAVSNDCAGSDCKVTKDASAEDLIKVYMKN